MFVDGLLLTENGGRPFPATYRLRLPSILRGTHTLTVNTIHADGRIGYGHTEVQLGNGAKSDDPAGTSR